MDTPVTARAAAPAARRRSWLGRLARPRALVRRVALLGLAGLVAWSVLTRAPVGPAVHPDRSVVDAGVRAGVEREVLVTVRGADGRIRQVLADASAVSAFLRREAAALEAERTAALGAAATRLDAAASAAFDAMAEGVERFADWYFAWGTAYRLAGRAAVSAAGALVDPRVDDIAETVGADVERYVETRYRTLVLRPEHTDPALEAAFLSAMDLLQARYRESVDRFDRQVRAFVATRTRHLRSTGTRRITLALDWDAQSARLALAGFDRGVLETGRTLALGLAGATAGRTAGAALGRAAAQRLSARLAAPHAARGIATFTGAAAGTGGGLAGAVAGAAIGLGADWLINEAVEVVKRPDFERDVRDLLALQRTQWTGAMHGALDEASRAWYGDLVEILARLDARG